jgi:hypothetical protein
MRKEYNGWSMVLRGVQPRKRKSSQYSVHGKSIEECVEKIKKGMSGFRQVLSVRLQPAIFETHQGLDGKDIEMVWVEAFCPSARLLTQDELVKYFQIKLI